MNIAENINRLKKTTSLILIIMLVSCSPSPEAVATQSVEA